MLREHSRTGRGGGILNSTDTVRLPWGSDQMRAGSGSVRTFDEMGGRPPSGGRRDPARAGLKGQSEDTPAEPIGGVPGLGARKKRGRA